MVVNNLSTMITCYLLIQTLDNYDKTKDEQLIGASLSELAPPYKVNSKIYILACLIRHPLYAWLKAV